MAVIETNKELRLENVLSLRKKMTQIEINEEISDINRFFESRGIEKQGSIVTVTYAIEQNNLFDMEILVPMNKAVELPQKYVFKPVFKLVNAIYVRHKGNPSLLQAVYNEILAYIHNNKLQQITPAYNVTIKEVTAGMNMEDVVIDIYIGISPNIL